MWETSLFPGAWLSFSGEQSPADQRLSPHSEALTKLLSSLSLGTPKTRVFLQNSKESILNVVI